MWRGNTSRYEKNLKKDLYPVQLNLSKTLARSEFEGMVGLDASDLLQTFDVPEDQNSPTHELWRRIVFDWKTLFSFPTYCVQAMRKQRELIGATQYVVL